MPDITMCVGDNCPLRKTCYRYRAKPDELYQSYFTESPFKDGGCEHYWEMNELENYWDLRDYEDINNEKLSKLLKK